MSVYERSRQAQALLNNASKVEQDLRKLVSLVEAIGIYDLSMYQTIAKAGRKMEFEELRDFVGGLDD